MRFFTRLLPALIPSWRFFDTIGPSPRIEYALLSAATEAPQAWRAFRPRPDHVSPSVMLARLFWNARWNETLFLVSCAERLLDHPTAHSENEIFARISADLDRQPGAAAGNWLCFRLVFLQREGETVVGEELFRSEPRQRSGLGAR